MAPRVDWEAFYRSYRKPGYLPGFEIVNKLGGGMFGLVFKARKESIGKDYAIKFLHVEDGAVRAAIAALAGILLVVLAPVRAAAAEAAASCANLNAAAVTATCSRTWPGATTAGRSAARAAPEMWTRMAV